MQSIWQCATVELGSGTSNFLTDIKENLNHNPHKVLYLMMIIDIDNNSGVFYNIIYYIIYKVIIKVVRLQFVFPISIEEVRVKFHQVGWSTLG